jgi:hypothetical protein
VAGEADELHNYYGDQMRKNEIGGAYSTNVGDKKRVQHFYWKT